MDHIGIDVHKRESQIYILAEGGEIIERRIRAEGERFAAVLGSRPRARILIEASTESEWVARGFEVKLVDPRQFKSVPGRKTDVRDCQWIQQLHTFGLLSAAFRPDDEICVLRSYLRQRAMLVTYASYHIQHMQKALEQMNLKLAHVVSDITGVTGMAIIRAILDGQRDPHELAKLRDRRCKTDEATIARALEGTWRSEHLFELRQAVELVEFYQKQIAACDRAIEAQLTRFEDKRGGQALSAEPRQRKARRTEPAFDARQHLYRVTGVDLTRIDGIDAHTALKVVGEIGLDMTRWPTEKNFASWLCLSPGSKITGGKRISGRTKPSASRAAAALRLAASSLYHSKSALGAYHRRMKACLRAPKAITATAHKLACLIYARLSSAPIRPPRPRRLRAPVPESHPLHSYASRSSARLHARQERGFPAGAQFTGVKTLLGRSQHEGPPRPRAPSLRPRSQAITPPAPHAASPLEPAGTAPGADPGGTPLVVGAGRPHGHIHCGRCSMKRVPSRLMFWRVPIAGPAAPDRHAARSGRDPEDPRARGDGPAQGRAPVPPHQSSVPPRPDLVLANVAAAVMPARQSVIRARSGPARTG